MTTKQHQELQRRLDALATQVETSDDRVEQTLAQASALVSTLEARLADAEKILRGSQADLLLRTSNLEDDQRALRGEVEQAVSTAQSMRTQLEELQADLDGRLKSLEQRFNEETNIPETPKELLAGAAEQEKAGNHKVARKLWRIYLTRYPNAKDSYTVRAAIGRAFFNEGDYRASLGELYRIVEEQPSDPALWDALLYSGLGWTKIGRCDSARQYFDVIRDPKQKAPKTYVDRANAEVKLIDADKGDLCADKAATPSSGPAGSASAGSSAGPR